MKADISRVLAGQQATAAVPRVTEPTRAPTRVVGAVPPPYVGPPPAHDEPQKSRVGLAIFIAGLVLVVLAAGAYGLYRAFGPQTPTPAAKVEVPAVLTYTEQQATDQLKAKNLAVTAREENGDPGTKGTVIAQDPIAGTQVDPGSTVTITVNVGPKTAVIPSGLVGKSLKDVQQKLANAHFTNVNPKPATAAQETGNAKPNEVLLVSPGEGESAALDAKITVTYATGKSLVPTLTDRLLDAAKTEASDAGFDNLKIVNQDSPKAAGLVIAQTPKAGTKVSRSTQIVLYIATPSPTPPPPSDTSSPSASPSGG